MPKQETCKRVLKVQNNLTACRGNQPILKLMKHSNAMFGGCAFTRKLERRQSIASREASRTYLTCHLYSNHHYHSGTSLVTRNRRICNLYNSCASHAFGYRRTLGLVRHPLLQASVRTICIYGYKYILDKPQFQTFQRLRRSSDTCIQEHLLLLLRSSMSRSAFAEINADNSQRDQLQF